MSIKKLLSAIVVIGVLSTSSPTYLRAAQVNSTQTPQQPIWPHGVTGSGLYASANPTLQDRAEWHVLSGGAGLFQIIGLGQAATLMEHYLANTGETVSVDPLRMLNDLPSWHADVESQTRQMSQQARQLIVTERGSLSARTRYTLLMRSDWIPAHATRAESLDWYLAVGNFSYKLMLTVTVDIAADTSDITLAHAGLSIYVYDRYDWDDGRNTAMGGLYIPNEWFGRLHRAGLARDYEVEGLTQPIRFDFPISRL